MADRLDLVILTPQAVFFRGKAESVIAPSSEGEFGVLPGHQPIAAPAVTGILRFRHDGEWEKLAITDGFVEVRSDVVTVLTRAAEWPAEIDIQRAQKAKARAEDRLKVDSLPWDKLQSEAALRRADNRIRLARAVKGSA